MIRKFLIIGIVLVLSCSEKEEEESQGTLPEVIEEVQIETPDRSVMIDETIASSVELAFGQSEKESKTVFAVVEDEKYLVQKYEGTFMEASSVNEMFLLRFEPYSYWEDNTEINVNSPYDYDLNVYLSKDQNGIIGFIDYTKATNNIVWDYFENLFTIYYYENSAGEVYPLNFIDLGKTEWDG